MLRHLMEVIADFFSRFVAADPKNAYEHAVFTAMRSIIITAFLKPIRGTYGPVTANR